MLSILGVQARISIAVLSQASRNKQNKEGYLPAGSISVALIGERSEALRSGWVT